MGITHIFAGVMSSNADGDADGGQSVKVHFASFHNVGTRPIATF